MRHQHGDLCLVTTERAGDLQRREDEASGCVEDDVQRYVVSGHLDRAQHLFRVVHIDVTHDRKSQELHRLLTVHEQDDPRVPLPFELRNLSHPHRVQHALPDDRLQRRQHEKDPKDVEHAHEILLFVVISPQTIPESAKPGMPSSTSRGHWRRLGGRNGPARMTPAIKPPIWAHQAIPPLASGVDQSATAPNA